MPDRYDITSGKSPYRPNQIPLRQRILYVVLALTLIFYGSIGVVADDLIVYGKGTAVHLSGVAAWLMFGALLCGSLLLLSVVVDHFDKRNNEGRYRLFSRALFIAGVALFFLALIAYVYNKVANAGA